MKKVINLIALFLVLCSVSCANENTTTYDDVVVSGIISNPNSKLVKISYEQTLFENKSHYLGNIDDKGAFKMSFKMDYPQSVYIKYDGKLMSLFLHPGDSLSLSINGEKGIKSAEFSGDAADQNSKLIAFSKEYRKIMISEKFHSKQKELNPAEFKNFITYYKAKCDSMINSLGGDAEITNWMHKNIKYRCFEALYEYGEDNEIPVTDMYYSFINDYTKNNDKALCTPRFSDFVDQYISYQDLLDPSIRERIMEAYKKKDKVLSLEIAIDAYGELKNDLVHVFLTKILYGTMERDIAAVEAVFEKYKTVVDNEQYIQLLHTAIEDHKVELLSEKKYITIQELANNDFVGKEFTELLEKFPNKVLYIDFWGVWCGPCIREFPHAEKMHESLKGKDVEFVNFCSQAKVSDWKKAIEKYHVTGQNYMLTDDQKIYLNTLFQFGGTPRYMIIDKRGRFVNIDADRPSKGEKIIEELLKYSDS